MVIKWNIKYWTNTLLIKQCHDLLSHILLEFCQHKRRLNNNEGVTTYDQIMVKGVMQFTALKTVTSASVVTALWITKPSLIIKIMQITSSYSADIRGFAYKI
jgi:hypothetical protein